MIPFSYVTIAADFHCFYDILTTWFISSNVVFMPDLFQNTVNISNLSAGSVVVYSWGPVLFPSLFSYTHALSLTPHTHTQTHTQSWYTVLWQKFLLFSDGPLLLSTLSSPQPKKIWCQNYLRGYRSNSSGTVQPFVIKDNLIMRKVQLPRVPHCVWVCMCMS